MGACPVGSRLRILLLVLGGIQNALAALFGKMFVGKAGTAMKGAKADKGEAQPGSQKGAPLGDKGGHLLHGVGYNLKDKHTSLKNREETSNMMTFLEAQKGDPKTDEKRAEATAETPEAETPETQERKDVRDVKDQDVRREEARDEARVQGQQEAQEHGETKEKSETQDAEQQQREDQEDEDKPGAGWVMEEADEDEGEEHRGLRRDQVLTDQTRCSGQLEDGTRCIRKPVAGLGYCREHTVNWRPDVSPKA